MTSWPLPRRRHRADAGRGIWPDRARTSSRSAARLCVDSAPVKRDALWPGRASASPTGPVTSDSTCGVAGLERRSRGREDAATDALRPARRPRADARSSSSPRGVLLEIGRRRIDLLVVSRELGVEFTRPLAPVLEFLRRLRVHFRILDRVTLDHGEFRGDLAQRLRIVFVEDVLLRDCEFLREDRLRVIPTCSLILTRETARDGTLRQRTRRPRRRSSGCFGEERRLDARHPASGGAQPIHTR